MTAFGTVMKTRKEGYEMEIEREYENKLDPEKVAEIKALISDDFRKHPMDGKKQYELLKDLLGDTELSRFFKDEYPVAAVQHKRDLDNGFFISLKTGYNMDQFVSFVVKDDELVFSLDHYLCNYCGYMCYCTPDLIIHEDIGHAFGSWTYKTYDTDGNQLDQTSKRDYGCCAD